MVPGMSKFSPVFYHRRGNANRGNEHCNSVNRGGHSI